MDKNLIIMTLYCGGSDGVGFYLGPKYLGWAQYGYDMEEILLKIIDKIDRNKKIEFRKVDLDKIDIYNELTQIDEDLFLEDDPDWWTEQELEAIYNNDLELLEKLIKERCPLDGEDN